MTPTIPPAILESIQLVLAQKPTAGCFVLHVKDGRIVGGEYTPPKVKLT